MKKQSNTLFLAQSAMIAAIYVVLTVILAPFSYGEVQVRVSEALTILPVFTPAAIPGLFVATTTQSSGFFSPIVPILKR